LLALNEMFAHPLSGEKLHKIAAGLGSDVPFFLQPLPALATGRGEQIAPLDRFPALRGTSLLLIHPGFGVPTAWAYQALARFPEALHGRKGRADELVRLLRESSLSEAAAGFSNSLEAPVLHKYPVLRLFQEFLRARGAAATLMSGSGSTTLAIFNAESDAQAASEEFRTEFGQEGWMAIVNL
jgi:4-diphosphocytidyl-2-C-methyl-D-erythritol kinase